MIRARFAARLAAALIPAALALAGPAPAAAQRTGAVVGRVHDAVTGRPVAGVEVRLLPALGWPAVIATAVTAAGGRYRIDGIAPGEYHVYAGSSAGYVGELSDGTPCFLDLHYRERFGGWLCGNRVVDPPRIPVRARETVTVPFALDLGGSVTGLVTAEATGEPVAAVTVSVSTPRGDVVGAAATDAAGRYRVAGLAAGGYRLSTANQAGLADEVHDGIHCDGRVNMVGPCDPRPGTPVALALRREVTIDFALERLGAIAGRITDAAGGVGLRGIDVTVERVDHLVSLGARTDADGGYFVGGLPAGGYRVATLNGGGWVDELYDGLPCAGGHCPWPEETPVAVVIDRVTAGVDFALDFGGSIAGSVVAEASGAPLGGVGVWFSSPDGVNFSAVRTDAAGRFRIGALPAGSYLLQTAGARVHGVTDEAFDGEACRLAEPCGLGLATPVAVALGEETAGIDFTLEPLGAIAGTVTDEETGAPIAGLPLLFHDPRGGFQFAHTDAAGRYRSPPLPRGEYGVLTHSTSEFPDLVDELYDDVRCFAGDCDPHSDGTPVTVASGATAGGVDFALSRGLAIEGRVIREADGGPERSASVVAYDHRGRGVRSAATGEDGRYRVIGLADGDYYLTTWADTHGLIDELYAGQQCVHGTGLGCTPTEGTPVRVAAGSPTPIVDFALADGFRAGVPCRPSPTRLCLAGGRYRVGVKRFTSFEPALAPARPISDSAGAFSLFAGDNVEAVLRLVDACAGFDRFWVLAARLSNLEVDAGVLDTVTGEARFYYSYELDPLLDTAAFDTCGTAAADPATLDFPAARSVPDAVTLGTCVVGPSTLCLLRGRFAVEAEWADGAGGGGAAGAAPLGDRSGYLWFHRPGSPEVVVKALDACDLPSPGFWIFASGLTDSDVTLTVTDTLSGESREYTNPLGRPFAPIRDFTTFRACP